jgi:alanine racemase
LYYWLYRKIFVKREPALRDTMKDNLLPDARPAACASTAYVAYKWEESFDTLDRPAWVEVDAEAIVENTRRLRAIVGPGVGVLGVVKADGYGHGAALAASAMLRGGAAGLGVATAGEGRRLRAAGIAAPILVLGHTPAEQVGAALRADLALSVGAFETARAAACAARSLGRPARLHLKIDSGMHRLGLLPREVGAFLLAASELPGLDWQAIYTHFATADEPERPELSAQLDRFIAVVEEARRAGWSFPIVHAANSAAALWRPETRLGLVRAGIALYGVAPGDMPLPVGFRPALAFRTRVARLADLPPGSPVSYGGDYVTAGERRIATIPAGYADGLRRSPPWRAALVRGRRAPIVGRICMDYAMLDVTDVPGVAMGDEVTLLGAQGQERITAEEVAGWLDTSAYEVLAALLPRGLRGAMGADAPAARSDAPSSVDQSTLPSASLDISELRSGVIRYEQTP